MCTALLLLTGVITLALPYFAFTAAAPTTTFAGQEQVTVPLDPAEKPMIYVSTTQQGTANCGVLDGPTRDGVALTQSADTPSIEVDGVTWQPLFHIEVPVPGDYQVACVADRGDATFGVGTEFTPVPQWLQLLLYACAGGLAALIGSSFRRRRSARGDK